MLLGRNVASVLANRGGEEGEFLDEMDEEELEELAGYREPVRSYAHAPMVCSPRARVGFPQQVLRGPHP